MEAEEPRDLLDDLPDHLLHYIFSFLGDNDLARLGVLSSRLRTLCTTSPYLAFSCTGKCRHFASYINSLLRRRQGLKIFRLRFSPTRPCLGTVDQRWINEAIVACNVQDLSLKYVTLSFFENLSSYRSLKFLQLEEQASPLKLPSVNLPSLETLCMDSLLIGLVSNQSVGEWVSTSFPCLKSLTLKRIVTEPFRPFSFSFEHNQTIIQDLTIQSSSLQDLTIEDGGNFNPVRIFAHNLRNLDFHYPDSSPSDGLGNKLSVEICAPNIYSFTWKGGARRLSYDEGEGGTFKTLYMATILHTDAWNTSPHLFLEILQAVRWARVLHIHRKLLKVLLQSPPFLLENLRHLNLILESSKHLVAHFVVPLLERSENLNSLTIANPCDTSWGYQEIKESNRGTLPLFEPFHQGIIDSCFKEWAFGEDRFKYGSVSIHGLKEVKITIYEFNREMAFLIKMLMKCGKNLEKMTITYPRFWERWMTQKGMQYIQNFERASPSLSVVLVPTDYIHPQEGRDDMAEDLIWGRRRVLHERDGRNKF